MASNSAAEVIKLIRSNILRVRTGLWLLPNELLGQERNEAARLLVDAVDLKEMFLKSIPADSRFVGLSDQKIIELLDEISENEGHSNCALVYNLDVLLSYLKSTNIDYVWQYLINFMPHRDRALCLTMPVLARDLLPTENQMDQMYRENRLAKTVT